MATVYLAQDLRHARPVALKLMTTQLAASVLPQRFLREVQLAARLDSNVVTHTGDEAEKPKRKLFSFLGK